MKQIGFYGETCVISAQSAWVWSRAAVTFGVNWLNFSQIGHTI
jgi:hypothetical protein